MIETMALPMLTTSVAAEASDAGDFVRRLQAGDERAALELYDRHVHEVRRLLWRVLGVDADHDDLVNETFLRVIRKIGQLREPERLRAWVLSVAVNTVRMNLRKRKVRRPLHSGADPTAQPAPPADLEGRALVQRAVAVLERMPVDERIAFVLRHVEGRELQEMTELCACSLATVKRRISRADKRFVAMARRDPWLADRLQRSARWKVDA